MKKTNRRNFIGGGVVAAAASAVPASAQQKTVKRVIYKDGKKPAKPPMFSSTVAFGNLLFLAGVGAHVPGDIKSHTKIVLDQIQQQLEAAGSSMEKVLKCNVYLSKAEDFAGMNEVFLGRFGAEPPVRTTIAAAWVPGDSLVEIDVIASL
jgi:2-iminobutanoate/2-iminopropanoate deaminase